MTTTTKFIETTIYQCDQCNWETDSQDDFTNTTVKCERCDEDVCDECLFSTGYTHYCETCYNEVIQTCQECLEQFDIEQDDIYQHDNGMYYCEDCFENVLETELEDE